MNFQVAIAPAGGSASVRLPQAPASLREANLLGQAVKKAPTARLEVQQGHRRANQSRYKAQCRMAMSF